MKIQIPSNHLALGVLGNEHALFQDELVYNGEDFYIYKNGMKIRKWFTYDYSRGIKTLWEPNARWSNAEKIEALKFKITNDKIRPIQEKIGVVIRNIFATKTKSAHAKPTHKYTGDKHWWEYSVDNVSGYGLGYSFSWVDKPKRLVNSVLGQELYLLSRRSDVLYRRLSVVNGYLEKAILSRLAEVKKKDTTVVNLKLNGRDYWYSTKYNRYGVLEWNKLSWPEDNTITIVGGK